MDLYLTSEEVKLINEEADRREKSAIIRINASRETKREKQRLAEEQEELLVDSQQQREIEIQNIVNSISTGDLYTDKKIESKCEVSLEENFKPALGELDIDNRLKSMEKILGKIKTDKVVSHEQWGVEESKDFWTTEEFSKVYKISKTQQATFRGRLEDPLKGDVLVKGGKIRYNKKIVKEWMERNCLDSF